jgi:glutathione-regulated potassium-efflux system ancillary protein KefF
LAEPAGRGPILVVLAHPYPRASRACAALARAASALPALEIRSLYERYPDFDIDVQAEQAALAGAGLVVWLHPMHWYGVPGLLKHWMDTVLVRGWAFGTDAVALAGKDCLWAVTTGGDDHAFSAEGRHRRPFADFAAPVEQTARFCGMNWLVPFAVHGAHEIPDDALESTARAFRARLDCWRAGAPQ